MTTLMLYAFGVHEDGGKIWKSVERKVGPIIFFI